MKPNADKSKPETKPGPKPEGSAKPESKDDMKSLPMPEFEKKLGSTPEGLSQAEAEKRLTQYGPNEIAEKKTNVILKFLGYFWGPIPWMIEAAVILSGVVKHWLDFFIILFLLFSNAVVAFWEEHQAGNAIDALKATLAIKARAKRDGKWTNPKATELVPGDVVRLWSGRHCAGRCPPSGWQLRRSGRVGVDRGVLACYVQTGRRGIFGLDSAPGRGRCHGLRHRNKHLFWQDSATCRRGPYRKPF